jgi:effector-binding domain-containing protein
MELTTRTIDALATPMIYVRSRSSMNGAEIARSMETAFGTLGRFIADKQVTPLGPPLAVNGDWTGALVTVDLGFPVSEADAAKAAGDVRAGKTPAGPAMKATHHGSYDKLKDTYALVEKAIEAEGGRMGDISWEIYFNEPGTTPEADLVTEVYVRLADPAARAVAR